MSAQTVTNWLSFSPANAVGKKRAYIDLPAFSVTGLTWKNASEIVLQYNFSASTSFILLNRPTTPSGANFGLCIRYRVGATVFRYKLWDSASFLLNVPLYNREIIKKNFVLEIWSYGEDGGSGETTAINTSAVRMITGVRTVPTDWRTDSADYALAVGGEFSALANTNVVPALVTENLVGHYDAALNHVEFDFSDKVQTMLNLSATPTLGNLTQATAGFRPSHSFISPPTPLLNYPTVLFDGVDDVLTSVNAANFPNGLSVFIIGTLKSWIADGMILTFLDTATRLYANGAGPSGTQKFRHNAFTSSGFIPAAALNEVTVIELFIGAVNGATFWKTLTDGVDEAHGSTAPVEGTLSVGADSFGGNPSELQLAEMLVYNAPVTLAGRTLIRQYLEAKYFGAIPMPLTFNSGSAWLDNS